MDSYTEVTTESWFGRMFSSLKSVVFGLVLIILAGYLLFWNEGRAVKTAQSLDEGGSAVISVAADTVNAANEGHEIHLSGQATAKDPLKDDEYNVTTPGPALLLSREVEMYQWKQEEHRSTHTRIGGGTETTTTYTYAGQWSSSLINSRAFHMGGHNNPTTMPPSKDTVSTIATLGAFTLPEPLIKKITVTTPLTPPANTVTPGFRVVDRYLYRGADPNNPSIGDVRVSFTYVAPADVSVIAQQSGSTLAPYQTKAGDTIEMLSMGTVPADVMFKQAQEQNANVTWILRGVGYLLMSIGIGSLFSPFITVASILPFLGDILGFGVFLFAMGVGAVVSLFIIAAGWIVYRPVLGVGLIAAGIALLVLLKQATRGRASRPA